MISSYRLGDLVLINLAHSEKVQLLQDHPGSFGEKFIIRQFANPNMDRLPELMAIINEDGQKYDALLPKDIEQSTVIHLRLGDVVCGNNWHEMEKRPLSIETLAAKIPKDGDGYGSLYVIGKCFFAHTSSPNYDECIDASNKYMSNVLEHFGAVHYDGGSADIDLYCALKAKNFVQGKGYFSKLIVALRGMLGKTSIVE